MDLREKLDVTGHINGFALRLDGFVLCSGTLTHCARMRAVCLEAAERIEPELSRIFKTKEAFQ